MSTHPSIIAQAHASGLMTDSQYDRWMVKLAELEASGRQDTVAEMVAYVSRAITAYEKEHS